MISSEFLISIIIPTKNRQKYALKAVEQILDINDNRIQVVIQDNSDTKELANMLLKYNNDKRLIYNYTEGIISFVDNFSIAISLSEGEYVCIIGDDDGVAPQIIEVAKWAKENNIDAIKPETSAVYFWPYSEAIGNLADDGYMTINNFTSKAKICNTYNEVVKLLKQGSQRYLSLNLVKLYHGIVKRECLDNIKVLTGKYFGGLSPDIYISVALSLTVNNVVAIDLPLTISGICNQSGSADSATGRHTGRLEDAPHFRGHEKYEWSEFVPRFYSVETIWADSSIAAINDLNKTDIIKFFNVWALSHCCLKKYPQFKDIIKSHFYSLIKEKGTSVTKLKIINFVISILYLSRKVIHRIKRKPSDIVRINGVINIIEADKILQQKFSELGIDNKKIITALEKTIAR